MFDRSCKATSGTSPNNASTSPACCHFSLNCGRSTGFRPAISTLGWGSPSHLTWTRGCASTLAPVDALTIENSHFTAARLGSLSNVALIPYCVFHVTRGTGRACSALGVADADAGADADADAGDGSGRP